ncbi:MAG: tetratricopeptide repeat protein [Planctomycetota bacterium]
MARIKATGDNSKLRQLADSFEKFLDRVSGREAGQTIQSLVYLADNFIELERYAKAIALLQKVIEHPEAADEANRASVNRARLLLARSQAKLGDFDDARATIDALLRENMNAKDVIMERGEILDASGDLGESIKHWKWVVNRMKQGRPRPPEFYQAVDRLIATFLKVSGPDRDKRLKEGEYLSNFLLQTDTNLPPEWRPTFEKHSAALKAAIGSN